MNVREITRCQASALFHSSERSTPERSVLIGDIATASVGVAQRGVEPVVFAVIAGSNERRPLQPDVFAGGNV
jgi:hypothetical protein